jgi:glycosyltransferase involved in cell wall biosynthesis
MRILVLTADLPPDNWSGIGVAVAHQTRAIAALGYDVDILTTAPRTEIPGVRVHPLPRDRFPADLPGPDCIHLHSLALSELALQLRSRLAAPLFYTAHSLLERELQEIADAGPWQELQQRIFKAADHTFFLTSIEREQAIADFPRLAQRSSVLPNGLPPSTAAGCSEARMRSPLILYAGRFARSKGTDIAAATMSALLDSFPTLHCALIGGHNVDSIFESSIADLIARYPDRVIAPGWLHTAELECFLRRAALLLMPSRYEPFGMIALESMRLGTPVLGADIDGLRELLTPGSGGVAVASHHVDEWVEAAKALLLDDLRRRLLSAAGPLFVDRNYNIADQAKRLVAQLRLHLTHSGPRPMRSPECAHVA